MTLMILPMDFGKGYASPAEVATAVLLVERLPALIKGPKKSNGDWPLNCGINQVPAKLFFSFSQLHLHSSTASCVEMTPPGTEDPWRVGQLVSCNCTGEYLS